MKSPYTIILLWSDEDQCYLVHLPEFPTQKFHTHGDTYEEALKNAQEVLELLIEEYQEDDKTLPQPLSVNEQSLITIG
ncbi:MAG: type II toxin-antitoxin system HicB family antitoxin [Crocosphaera sp.]